MGTEPPPPLQTVDSASILLHEDNYEKPQNNLLAYKRQQQLQQQQQQLLSTTIESTNHHNTSSLLSQQQRQVPESPFKGRSSHHHHNNRTTNNNNNHTIISTLINTDLSNNNQTNQVITIRRTPFQRRHSIQSSKQRRHYFIKHIQFHPLMAFISAAIEIQRCIKGFLTRRGFYIKKINELKLARKLKEEEQFKKCSTLFEIATKSLITPIARKNEENIQSFMNSYMSVIQAKFHQLLTVWRFNNDEYLRNQLAHLSASIIQSRYKLYRRRMFERTGNKNVFFKKYKMYFYDRKCHAAFIIQRWWRRVINKQIFQFYKQLILFKERTHPYDILKSINPLESQLIDPSIGAFIRFRLGGSLFPPLVFYKVYLKRSIIDINSFAPRNYSGERQQIDSYNINSNNNRNTINGNAKNGNTIIGQFTFSDHKQVLSSKWEFQDWYQRVEGNSWRPVASTTLLFNNNNNNNNRNEDLLDDPLFSNSCCQFILDRAKKESKLLNKQKKRGGSSGSSGNSRNTLSNIMYSESTTSKVIQIAQDDKELMDTLMPYHYLPQQRRVNQQRRRRKRRLEWLIKMKKAELLNKPHPKGTTMDDSGDELLNDELSDEHELLDEPVEAQEETTLVRTVNSDLRALALTIKEKDLLAELEEVELFGDVALVEDEMDDLLQWCNDLDYYQYVENWHSLATTLPSDQPRRPKQQKHLKSECTSSGGGAKSADELKREMQWRRQQQEEMLPTNMLLSSRSGDGINNRNGIIRTPDSEYTTITTVTNIGGGVDNPITVLSERGTIRE